MNPPGHHPDAKDFVAVDEAGKPYKQLALVRHLFCRLHVSQVYGWEKKVYAPFDGEIIETANTSQDRQTLNLFRDGVTALVLAPRQQPHDSAFFLGNHVIMRSDQGVHALFAHFRQGSLVVRQGNRVRAGEAIAAIGNSGNTIQPHLHFQLMQDNAPFTAMPLPFVFSGYEKKEGGVWKSEALTLPRNRQVFRTIEAV